MSINRLSARLRIAHRPLSALTLLALSCALQAAPAKPAAPAPVPDTPAVAAVRLYVADHLAGQEDKAYALLSENTQAMFPAAQREQVAKSVTSPDMLKSLPPAVLPVLALFADIHDTLHFKFRVLGPSPDDPTLVLVRTYQVGTPPSTVKVLRVVTVADAGAAGSVRVDAEKTMLLAAPEMAKMRANAQTASSESNLKQLGLAILEYVQDHNETMPDADRWVDEIMPYAKSEALFRDPSAPSGERWSYAFNKNLSGIKLADLISPATTVILFESTLGTKNATDTGESVPKPGRHNGGTDYAFSDGHVKWLSDATTPAPSFLLTGE